MRSILALGILIVPVLLPTPQRCITADRTQASYAQPNLSLPPRPTLFPVGPRNRRGTGWIATTAERIDADRQDDPQKGRTARPRPSPQIPYPAHRADAQTTAPRPVRAVSARAFSAL